MRREIVTQNIVYWYIGRGFSRDGKKKNKSKEKEMKRKKEREERVKKEIKKKESKEKKEEVKKKKEVKIKEEIKKRKKKKKESKEKMEEIKNKKIDLESSVRGKNTRGYNSRFSTNFRFDMKIYVRLLRDRLSPREAGAGLL